MKYEETNNLLDYWAESEAAYNEHMAERKPKKIGSKGTARAYLQTTEAVNLDIFVRPTPKLLPKIPPLLDAPKPAQEPGIEEQEPVDNSTPAEYDPPEDYECRPTRAIIGNKVGVILAVMSRHHGIPAEDISGQRRTRPLVHLRQEVMFIAKYLTTRSLPEIARVLGGRDHTTILHGVKAVALRNDLDYTDYSSCRALAEEKWNEINGITND
jgi:hypothetical protein